MEFFFVFMIALLFQLPSVNDGFYWIPGSMNYMLGSALTLLFISFLIKLIYKEHIKNLLIPLVLLFLIYGTNEISMVILNLVLFVVLCYRFYLQRRINYSILILLFLSILFTIIVLLSPGNAIRASKYSNNHNLLESLGYSLLATKTYVGIWLSFILIILSYYFPIFKKEKVLEWRLFNINPLLILLVIFLITIIAFFPAYWSMGAIGPPKRLINGIYFFFLAGIIYFFLCSLCYFKKRDKSFISYSKWVKISLLILLILQLGHNNNIRIAYHDLISGKASKFDIAMKNRYQLINTSKRDTVVVPRLKNIPKTIYHDDINNDFNDWKNIAYNAYFNKIIIIDK